MPKITFLGAGSTIFAKSVLGDQQAAILATGTEDQKKAAIAQWLPKQ